MAKFYSLMSPPPTLQKSYDKYWFSDTLEECVDSKGVRGVRVSGKFNLFEYVQSSRLVTDIYHLVDRYSNGDFMALNARPAQYADLTDMPISVHDLASKLTSVQKVFDSLDPDVKAYYGNDLMAFLSRYESDLASSKPVEEVKTVEEV